MTLIDDKKSTALRNQKIFYDPDSRSMPTTTEISMERMGLEKSEELERMAGG
jgi:hypothetical protein